MVQQFHFLAVTEEAGVCASHRGSVVFTRLPRVSVQLSLASAALILKHIRTLLAPSPLSAAFVADRGRARELVLLVSGVLEVATREPSREADHLHVEGIQAISDVLLVSHTVSSMGAMQPSLPRTEPCLWFLPEPRSTLAPECCFLCCVKV